MALRMTLSVSLVVALMATSIAQAQLGGLIGGLLGSSLNLQGIVFCTADGNIGINGTATPVFPNALVQLQCGAGNVVSSTTTNGAGIFSFTLDPLQQIILSSLLANCSVVVKTPLSTCNVKLPAVGVLQAPLKYVGDSLVGLLRILNVVPSLFKFVPILN